MSAFSFIRFYGKRADKSPNVVGGTIHTMLNSAAATLLTGDCVYVSGSGVVGKSNTSADYAGFAGVVVGGASTFFRTLTGVNETGKIAALPNQLVLIQKTGIARVIAEGAISAGTTKSVVISTITAGKVVSGNGVGQMLGVPLIDAISGQEFLMFIQPR